LCRWHATYHWKVLDEGYNFALTSLGNPRAKWHLGASPVARHKVYYKGEGGGFTPSLGHGESCEFVFARGLFVHQKWSNYTLTNLLFGLCRSMWIIKLLVNLPIPHPEILAHPFTFEVLRTKEHTQFLLLPLSSPLDS
jgi:hypothetical protein